MVKQNLFTRVAKWYLERKMTPDEDQLLREYLGLDTASGIAVNWRTAMEFSVSLACARAIATGLMVPFKLFRSKDGSKLPATDDNRYGLLHDSPNDFQTAPEFMEMIGYHLVFCGNAFVWKNIVDGKIVELLAYDPGMVTVERNDWELSYRITPEKGSPISIPKEQMWHIRGPSWNGWMGMDGVRLARNVLSLGMAQQNYGTKFFRNNSIPSGVLQSEKEYPGKEKAKAMREAWENAFGGENSQKTAIAWAGLKWATVTIPNDNAQFIESRKFQIEEVCRMFGVNPLRVYYSDKTSTYASAEQFFTSHVIHDLMPWYVRVEMSASKNLLTDTDRANGMYFKFLANGLMRGSIEARANYYSKALGTGGSSPWMTQDEVRDLEDSNPMGGNAAILREPSNVGTTIAVT